MLKMRLGQQLGQISKYSIQHSDTFVHTVACCWWHLTVVIRIKLMHHRKHSNHQASTTRTLIHGSQELRMLDQKDSAPTRKRCNSMHNATDRRQTGRRCKRTCCIGVEAEMLIMTEGGNKKIKRKWQLDNSMRRYSFCLITAMQNGNAGNRKCCIDQEAETTFAGCLTLSAPGALQ